MSKSYSRPCAAGFDLDVAAGLECNLFARGQFQDEFLDESRDVVVGTNPALPLFGFQGLGGTSTFMSCLTATWQKSIAFARLALVDVGSFGRQDVAAAGEYFHLALGASAAAAAGRGDKDSGVGEAAQQLAASRDVDRFLVVDRDSDVAAGDQLRLGYQDEHHQRQHDQGEHHNAKETSSMTVHVRAATR